MFRPRPLIGVTGPSRSAFPSWFFIRLLVWLAGGKCVQIRPNSPLPSKKFSGLILGGGADVDPSRYKEKLITTLKEESGKNQRRYRYFLFYVFIWLFRRLFSLQFTTQREDKERDHLEFQILQRAVENRIPIFGICRGAQVLNVFFGGSLHQEIADFYTEQPHLNTILPKSTVVVDPQSRLYEIIGKKFIRVNSLHHQAVKTLGKSLKISAKEPNGIIEAIEHTELPFVIGVQWHPEFLLPYPRQRKLFAKFVEASRTANPILIG